jgi:hypothetical protein
MVVRVGGEVLDTRDGGGRRAIKGDALPERDGARMRADEVRDEGDHGLLHGVHPPAAARPRPSNRAWHFDSSSPNFFGRTNLTYW